MNKNQFIYTRKVPMPPKEGESELQYKLAKDCFNINKVIRAIEMDNGDLFVLLDDLHQRKQEVPIRNKKGEITGMKNEINAFQSELTVLKEEVEEFYNTVAINKK